jgi:hypothetical protein
MREACGASRAPERSRFVDGHVAWRVASEPSASRLGCLQTAEAVVELLMTTPGVGPTIAASFVGVIDDAKRFRSS